MYMQGLCCPAAEELVLVLTLQGDQFSVLRLEHLACLVQEWARQENEYADMHGPQEELLTTEDLQNFK